jgi:uncharacterized protein
VIFVDTSAWFAGSVPGDANHDAANALFAAVPARQLVTSDYVFDEVVTLLRARGESNRALQLGRQILERHVCELVWVDERDVYKAWTYFETYRNRGWSFTDCVSRAVIERLEIVEAFAFDDHFREFGAVSVLP